jgi:guanylate kinase
MSRRDTARPGLYIVSGPSGAGKTSVCGPLLASIGSVEPGVSVTTRRARAGEREGQDYRFVDAATFDAMVAAGEFAEWAEVHGNRYGTTCRSIEEPVEGGRAVLLDIDVQGARQLRALYPDAVTVFLMPPSPEILEQRLAARGTEARTDLELRLATACSEIVEAANYDYVIVNDDLDTAAGELRSLVVDGPDRQSRHPSERIRDLVAAFGARR